jgi:hypothetical protein
MPSLAIKLLSRSRRPWPSRRALRYPQFAIAPSIAAHRRCALGPSSPRSRHPSPSRSHRAVSPRRGAVAPSIAVEEPSRRTSPSRSRRPCRLTTPATRHAPPRPLVRMVAALPLLIPPPSICRHLSLRHCLSCLSSVGWLSRLLASHATTSHLLAPPPLIAPSPLVTPLSGLSSSWLRRHLSSRRHQKTVHERQEKVERNVMIIQAAKGGDVTKLTGANLTVLLT